MLLVLFLNALKLACDEMLWSMVYRFYSVFISAVPVLRYDIAHVVFFAKMSE